MKGAKELLIASLLAAGSLSVSFGATFALFTSSSSVDVNIATAEISLTPVLSLDSASSNGVSVAVEESNHARFANGNEISVVNGEIFVGLTSGDYFTLNVKGLNSSNINIKYRGYIQVASDEYGLAPYLDYSYTGFANTWTDAVKSDSETVDSGAKITIGLPSGITGDWTGKSVNLKVGYEAVQGNADLANGYTSYALSAAESPFAFNVVEPMSGLKASGVSSTSRAQIGLYVAPAEGKTPLLRNKVAYQVALSGQKPESNVNVTVPYKTELSVSAVKVYIGGNLISSSTYDPETDLVSFSADSDSLGLIEIGEEIGQ